MARRPSAAVEAAAMADERKVSPDKLAEINRVAIEARDLRVSLEARKEAMKEDNVKLRDIEFVKLPELLMAASLRGVTLEPQGNYPAYDVKLHPYYKANIEADWPEDQREKGFAYLEKEGVKDMIKTVIVIELDRRDRALAKKVEAALRKLKVGFASEKSVPWNTLTAWMKEKIEKHGETPNLSLIGGIVGNIATIKPVKEK